MAERFSHRSPVFPLTPDPHRPISRLHLGNGRSGRMKVFSLLRKHKMQPPMSPAQLAAQKHELVESFEDLVKGGLGEPYPVITLVTTGRNAPKEAPAKIEYGRAAVAAFLASHLASAPPADMTKVPAYQFSRLNISTTSPSLSSGPTHRGSRTAPSTSPSIATAGAK